MAGARSVYGLAYGRCLSDVGIDLPEWFIYVDINKRPLSQSFNRPVRLGDKPFLPKRVIVPEKGE